MPNIDPDLSITQQRDVVVGSVADWALQAVNRDGTFPAFASGDTVSAKIYRGADQVVLITPTAAWTGGTGYSTGAVTVSPTSAQTALLEAEGDYTLQVWWSQASPARTACILRAQVIALPGPGTSSQAVVPYCTLGDILNVADWVRRVQSMDVDQEGFYSQRLQARQWMDQAILNCYRGAFVGLFESHSTAAFEFGYAGWRRSLGPSPSLITYLANNNLLVKPYIVEATAHWSASLIGLRQVGTNNQLAAYGAYHRDMAERKMVAITAEVDINNDGIGELFISLGSTNTLFT